MTIYPEPSLLVSAFTSEAASEAARAWLADIAPSELTTSLWCDTEIVSALAIKVRRGELASANYDGTVRAVRASLRSSAASIPITADHFRNAADLIQRSPKPLRPPDALHLAIAQAGGAVVWTLDVGMAKAGQALGLGTRLLA